MQICALFEMQNSIRIVVPLIYEVRISCTRCLGRAKKYLGVLPLQRCVQAYRRNIDWMGTEIAIEIGWGMSGIGQAIKKANVRGGYLYR